MTATEKPESIMDANNNLDALDHLFDYAGNMILLFTALIVICGPALYEIAR